ncbi:MAG: histidine phosphatase family protein [Rhodobacteraceae bacterium]|nr:histidine phosphatase family protein [Paracoccaceae bacterium]
MTLRLILTRHAKSSWDSPAPDDHARPLNGRGRRSASAIGGWLNDSNYTPDLVLSSDSARTRETWALIEATLDQAPDQVVWLKELYHAPAQTMLEVLKAAGTAASVMMLGHNPGIGGFANMLAARPPRHARYRDYPTAATAIMQFDAARWRDVDWGMGSVVDFTVPRDLGVT